MTYFSKEDDYTLLVSNSLPDKEGTLSRYFNFAACQVTTIYSRRADLEKHNTERGYGSASSSTSVSVATALTSQMHVQKFSELDSPQEIVLLHAKLVNLKGNPPPLSVALTGRLDKKS